MTVEGDGGQHERSFGRPSRLRYPTSSRQSYRLVCDTVSEDSRLCAECGGLDLRRLIAERREYDHHASLDELLDSSATCPLCCLFVLSFVGPRNFEADNGRPITIKANIGTISVSFPMVRASPKDTLLECTSELNISVAPGISDHCV